MIAAAIIAVFILALLWLAYELHKAPVKQSDDNDNFYRAVGIMRGPVNDSATERTE